MHTKKSNYADLLKDPRWQKKRLQIFKRDKFKCRTCGSIENTLHVHHKEYVYGKSPWSYKSGCYVTVCNLCHTIITYYKKRYGVDVSSDQIHYLPVSEVEISHYIIGHGNAIIIGHINNNGEDHGAIVFTGPESFGIISQYITEYNSKNNTNG